MKKTIKNILIGTAFMSSTMLMANESFKRTLEADLSFEVYPIASNEITPSIYTRFGNRKAKQDLRGVAFKGKTISLTGNKWVVADLVDGIVDGKPVEYEDSYFGDGYDGYKITKDTYIEFDYVCHEEGEIHGLTFEKVKNPKARETVRNRIRLNGTQRESRLGEVMDYKYEASDMGKYKHFKIKIGDIYEPGNYRLVLINDHDVEKPTAKSTFRNIKVYSEKSIEEESSIEETASVKEFDLFDQIPYETDAEIAAYKNGGYWAVKTYLENLPENYSEFINWEWSDFYYVVGESKVFEDGFYGVGGRFASYLDENNDKSELFYQHLLELKKMANNSHRIFTLR